jgi:pyridoxal phosphate enzyme (YggS family)
VGDIAAAWASISTEAGEACLRAGRTPGSVEVLAVSKLQPLAALREAHAAGVRAFGENYAQELRDKAAALADCTDIRWHAIGTLQTNKAKYVAKSADVFHALDRLSLAEELARRRTGAPLEVYLEVNLGGETSKSGLAKEGIASLLQAVRALPQLKAVGLMCLPPYSKDAEASRPYFRSLCELARQYALPGLSMGTSQDFPVAIEEGATVVRVGTLLFGERPGRALGTSEEPTFP